MALTLAAIFSTGIQLGGAPRFLLMLPLCLSIAVVYKAIHCERLADLPVSILMLWLTIAAGMGAVGLGLWLAFEIAV